MTARAVAGAAALAVFALATIFGARTASGADSLGYVSQAYLWSAESLEIEQPLLRDARWPFAAFSLAPLGYRSTEHGTAVPTYPPGIPLTMAALRGIAGAWGPFLVAPLFGAGLVLATGLLAARMTRDPVAAAIAPVLMATSPTFLVNVVVPMSDTATAALWTLSLCAVTWQGWKPAAIGGTLAGWAILARPNLVPLALAGAVAAEMWRGAGERRGLRGVSYLAAPGLAALFIAGLNDRLYGSPFLSGYGPTRDLYALAYAGRNLSQFGLWLLETEWPALILLILGAGAIRGLPSLEFRRPSAPLAVFLSVVGASYLFYLPFDAWWFLRFLLPAYPVMFVAIAAVTAHAFRRLSWSPSARAAAFAATVLVLMAAIRVAPYVNEILTIGPGEDRYTSVARFITGGLPANAVLIGMQHTGTIRFYAARPTVRFERITPERLVFVVESLRDHGYRPFLVLENWEEEQFRRRFASTGPIGRLEVRTVAELTGPVEVRIYDPLDTAGYGARPFQLHVQRGDCAQPHPNWRTLSRLP